MGRRLLWAPIGVWLIIATARLATVGVMAVGRATFPLAPLEGSWMVEEKPFMDYLANFDGAWFIRVAALGYKKLQSGDYDLETEKKRLRVMDERGYEEGKKYFSYRHFPLFPYIIRATQKIFRDFTLSGLIVANFFSFAYLLYIFRLTELEFGERAGWWASAFAACAPAAHYYVDLYSEGMLMLFIVSSIYQARKGHWGWATLLGFLANATRPEGVFLCVALFLILADQSGGWRAALKDKRLLGLIVVPMGLLFIIIEFWRVSGSPIAPYIATTKTLGSFKIWPWQAFAMDFRHPSILTFGVDVPAFFAIVLLTILSARRLPMPLAIFTFAQLCPFLVHPHIGVLRVSLMFFAFHLYLGELATRRPHLAIILLISFTILLFVFSILFIAGYWIS